jgi:hypothetical protein
VKPRRGKASLEREMTRDVGFAGIAAATELVVSPEKSAFAAGEVAWLRPKALARLRPTAGPSLLVCAPM